MRLCLAAGRITDVDQIASTMPARTLREWMAFDMIDPLPDRRLDTLFGLLGSLIAATGGAELDPETFALHDRGGKGESGGLPCDDWRLTKQRAEMSVR